MKKVKTKRVGKAKLVPGIVPEKSFLERVREQRAKNELALEEAKKQTFKRVWTILSPTYGLRGPYPSGSEEAGHAVTRLEEILLADTTCYTYTGVPLTQLNAARLPGLPSVAMVQTAKGLTGSNTGYAIDQFYIEAAKQLKDAFVERHPEFDGHVSTRSAVVEFSMSEKKINPV